MGRNKREARPEDMGRNVPFATWAVDALRQQLDEWEAAPYQLGWKNEDEAHGNQLNMEHDEVDDEADITPAEQSKISQRIVKSDSMPYVPRSEREFEESAVLTKLDKNGDLVLDRYSDVTSKKLPDSASQEPRRPEFSSEDIGAAQDMAMATLKEQQAVWAQIFASDPTVAKPKIKLVIRKPRVAPLSKAALDELMNPLHLPPVPLTTEGFELGEQSLSLRPEEDTLTQYASKKLSGLNPGNCDGDLLPKLYDAILQMEKKLAEEGRINEYGWLLTEGGKMYLSKAARRQTLQALFHEAMLSVDRVVGRHTSRGTFIEAPPKPSGQDERPTFRLGVYEVLER